MHGKQQGGNAGIMKTTSVRRKSQPRPEGMRREYRFDYKKARPNRFAAEMASGTVAVVLDPDVAEVFKSSESVNALLRSVISALPAGSKP